MSEPTTTTTTTTREGVRATHDARPDVDGADLGKGRLAVLPSRVACSLTESAKRPGRGDDDDRRRTELGRPGELVDLAWHVALERGRGRRRDGPLGESPRGERAVRVECADRGRGRRDTSGSGSGDGGRGAEDRAGGVGEHDGVEVVVKWSCSCQECSEGERGKDARASREQEVTARDPSESKWGRGKGTRPEGARARHLLRQAGQVACCSLNIQMTLTDSGPDPAIPHPRRDSRELGDCALHHRARPCLALGGTKP